MNHARMPLIGITTYNRNEAGDITLPATYVDAVHLAGGVPILLPPRQTHPAQILEMLDGLILAGGGDIDPALYGGTQHPEIYSIDRDRDAFELTLAKHAFTAEIPTLGICRGMQMFTVVTGGDLVAHVPDVYGDSVTHRLNDPNRPFAHDVHIQPNSRLASILGVAKINVVSFHHQAVKTVPPHWKAVAHAADGLVEAMEHQQHPWLMAVQWHPEMSVADSAHRNLFRAFVQAASDRHHSFRSIA